MTTCDSSISVGDALEIKPNQRGDVNTMAKAAKHVPNTTSATTENDTVLEYIKSQTAEHGFAYVDPNHEAVKRHAAAGTIELKPEAVNERGHVAARLTEATAGINEETANTVDAMVAKPAKVEYAISDDVPLAPAKRGVTREEEYPFSKLEIGKSFVVPISDTHKEPWNTFPSTVSSATRRFATPHPEKTRKDKNGLIVPVMVPTRRFTSRRVFAGQKYENGFVEPVDGVRVYRVALKANDTVE